LPGSGVDLAIYEGMKPICFGSRLGKAWSKRAVTKIAPGEIPREGDRT